MEAEPQLQELRVAFLQPLCCKDMGHPQNEGMQRVQAHILAGQSPGKFTEHWPALHGGPAPISLPALPSQAPNSDMQRWACFTCLLVRLHLLSDGVFLVN